MMDTLVINEVYLSLQGESTWAGWPCIFVRTTGCDLRCSYCDTAYAFSEGERMSLESILVRIRELAAPYHGPSHPWPMVELTGGEPLLQSGTRPLLRALCNEDFIVLLETSGAHDIREVDARVHRIVDLKCPGSGEADRNLWSNLAVLKPGDEVKFVITSREDYAWAKEILRQYHLNTVCPVLFSWAAQPVLEPRDPRLKAVPGDHRFLSGRELAESIIADALPVRYQVQLHKLLWPERSRGV